MAHHQERMVSVRDGKIEVSVLEGGTGEPLVFLTRRGGPQPAGTPT